VARAALSATEQEEDKLFWETYDSFTKYLAESTNCSVIRHPEAEADDIIARWIALHPQDEHYIISSDTDFVQLLAPNVSQYNGITDELHTVTGIFDAKGRRVQDKKTKTDKVIPDPEWLLFEKCMRGDTSDNVFSAYPGVREKGTKNRVGLREAFEDRTNRGFNWNNLMLQRWTDHTGQEHRVLDDYERNRTLVDLTAQPDHIKIMIAETIANASMPKNASMIGAQFLKFCGKYDLIKLSENANNIAEWLGASYPDNALKQTA
jgi:5'-3' exonuclease